MFSAPESTPRPADTGAAGAARPPGRANPSGRRLPPPPAPPAGHPREPGFLVLGCGALAARTFLPALHALQHAGRLRVHALIDPLEAPRAWAGRRFPEAQSLPSLEAVAAPPGTVAVLCTPARHHPLQAAAAFKRGWHVLATSPFAPGVREGSQLLATAQRHDRLIAADLALRFQPAAAYLRTLCRDHLLGPPISCHLHAGTARRIPDDGPPPPEKPEHVDGVLEEVGTPVLDFLTWCLGPATVRSYADDAMGGVEANAVVQLSFPDRTQGTVHLSREWDTPRSATFVFERALVRWDLTRPAGLTIQLASAGAALTGELSPALPACGGRIPRGPTAAPPDAHLALLENLIAALGRREPLRCAAAESLPALALIEECYARRGALVPPWLEPTEAVHARAYAPPASLRRP